MNKKDNENLEINYSQLTIEAMKSLIHKVLNIVSERGLPDKHHFYISFNTKAKNVIIPKELTNKYPEEMTIVIENTFWDLKVNDKDFSLILSFDNVKKKLIITFDSILSFSDPHANFMLNFQNQINKNPSLEKTTKKKSSNVINIKNFKKDL